MLNKIKEYIEHLPDLSFEEYFLNYIMEVQDANIDKEMDKYNKYLSSYSSMSAISNMLEDTYKRMVNINDECSRTSK